MIRSGQSCLLGTMMGGAYSQSFHFLAASLYGEIRTTPHVVFQDSTTLDPTYLWLIEDSVHGNGLFSLKSKAAYDRVYLEAQSSSAVGLDDDNRSEDTSWDLLLQASGLYLIRSHAKQLFLARNDKLAENNAASHYGLFVFSDAGNV
jgi:hypothetical protein